MKNYNKVIAISFEDFNNLGCPNCGYKKGYELISFKNTTVFSCGYCDFNFLILDNGKIKSEIGVGKGNIGEGYPEIQSHPRLKQQRSILKCLKNLMTKFSRKLGKQLEKVKKHLKK